MNTRRVYFIRPVGLDGPVKIGCSMSPDGRRETLETWSPFALEIIAEIEGDFRLERRFHAYFKDTFQRREWFGWSDRMAAVVAAIHAGTFDTNTLPDPTNMGKPWIKRRRWTEDQKLRASYSSRLRQTCRRTGFYFPLHIQNVDLDETWREHIPAMNAYFANPAEHGKAVANLLRDHPITPSALPSLPLRQPEPGAVELASMAAPGFSGRVG